MYKIIIYTKKLGGHLRTPLLLAAYTRQVKQNLAITHRNHQKSEN